MEMVSVYDNCNDMEFSNICEILNTNNWRYGFNPGGNHGLFCVQQLENVIGPPGLTALLLLTALAFLTYLSAEL